MSAKARDVGRPYRAPLGRANIRAAWWMIGASMAVGAVLGLWSFGGPVAQRRDARQAARQAAALAQRAGSSSL